jgi:type I restriction enzyme S subunit
MANKLQPTPYGDFAADLAMSRLASICDPKEGIQTGPFGSQLHQGDYVSAGTPIVTVEHLGENRIRHEGVPFVSELDRDRLSKYLLRKGDIVFSRVGSVDRRALVRDAEEGWLFSGRCLRVRPDKSKIDPRYLSYFFGLPAFKEHVRAIAFGATMPSLNTQLLSDLCVLYPKDLVEQRAIAQILGLLDDKIDLNRRMTETLEAMARAVFKSWFVDFDPVRSKAEGQNTELPKHISSLFPDSFEDSEIGEIPKGWHLATVASLADINAWTLGSKDPLDMIEYIEISEAMRGSIGKITQYERGTEPSRARRRLRHGDTVLSTVRPDRGAYFLVLDPPEALIASTGFAVLSPRSPNWAYLYASVTRVEVGEELGRIADGGAYPAVRPEVIGDLKVAIPKNPMLITEYDKVAQPLFRRSESNRRASAALTTLRDTLLPRLISGELRVEISRGQR